MSKQEALERVSALSQKIANGEMSLDQWKWNRAEAMAQAAGAGATQREIAEVARMNQSKVGRHIKVWLESGTGSDRPSWSEAFDAANGFDRDEAQTRTDAARTKRTLMDAPLEQIERIIDQLPSERKQAVAAAAGHSYLKARQDYDDGERQIGGDERKKRDEAQEQMTRRLRDATSGFTTMGIVGHLGQATEELRELNADSSVTSEAAEKIEAAIQAFLAEFRFAQQMLGMEVE